MLFISQEQIYQTKIQLIKLLNEVADQVVVVVYMWKTELIIQNIMYLAFIEVLLAEKIFEAIHYGIHVSNHFHTIELDKTTSLITSYITNDKHNLH